MIKTELEWHSNNEAPTPEYHCYYFMICDLFGEFYQVDANFEDDVFKEFIGKEDEDLYWELKDITCWTMLPSSTTLMELFTDDTEQLEYDNIFDAITDDKELAAEMKHRADLKLKEREESFIVANMAQCALCKDVIESRSRHDFQSCTCQAIFVDGGHSYLRRGGDLKNIIELSVHSNDDYETIRTHFKRGSRGVKGDEPLTWVNLKDMTVDHLRATIEYDKVNNPNSQYTKLYEKELKYRGEWK